MREGNYGTILPDNRRLSVCYGGDHDEIYRHDVGVGEPIKIKDLQPYSGFVYDGTNEIESFYDY